ASLVDLSTESLQKRFPAFAAAAEPIRQAIKTTEKEKPTPLERIAATFESTNAPPVHHLLVRGSHAKDGNEIPPRVPAIFGTTFPVAELASNKHSIQSSQRRLALARWLTSPENPMVARVLVNRIWHYHFGRGLVATIENLGQSGARPVQPELLDWLA